jgi:Nucleosome binding factor SPN, SPT16 subunit
MIKDNGRKVANKKNESVEDPHELLLSLVDLGSLDAEEALLACVTEMSDAECKRVLGSLSLPNCCDEVDDDEMSVEVDEPADDADMEVEFPSDDEEADEEDEDDAEEVEFDEDDEEDEDEIELEARIRRLERSLRSESMNRNRVRRFTRRANR